MTPKRQTTPTPPAEIAEAEARLTAAEAKVAALTHQVFVEMPAEQRELADGIDQARRANDNAAWREGRSALDANKRRRNAAIDELDAAKGAVIQAKAELTRLRQAERWRETMARAEEMGTATPAELLEEQRQIPGRLAQATRDLDIEQVQALRRRLAELPEEIYAARVLEVGRAIEQLRARVIAERAAATALAPDLEQAEEQVRLATEARDRIAAQVHWHLEDAHGAAQDARARERELGDLAAQASDGRPRAGAVA